MNYETANLRSNQLLGRLQALREQQSSLEKSLETCRTEIKEIHDASKLLMHMAEKLNERNEEQAARLVTSALRETFPDLELTLTSKHGSSRGNPSVELLLREEKAKIEDDPMDSFGGGPASIIGLVLRVVAVCRQKNLAKVLLLDEPVIQVSQKYQDNTAKLLRRLCEPVDKGGLGFKMLVVTHNPVLERHAHKRYLAEKGDDGRTLTLKELPVEEEMIL
jgi:DNA repair ATPase RecN